MDDLIPLPTRATAQLVVHSVGAHRGAEESQSAYEHVVTGSRPLDITYIDPVLGRADRLAQSGRKRGLKTHAIEARFEEVVSRELPLPAVNVMQVDRASTIVAALAHADAFRYATMGFLLVDAPKVGLLALRFTAGAEDTQTRQRLAALFTGIAAVSSREGSEVFFGAGSAPERAAIEARMRASFATYLADRIGKIAVGLDASGPAVEASLDGVSQRPVVIVADDVLEEEPYRLAERVIDERQFTPRRGTAFTVFEVARLPEPAVRVRSGMVRRDHLLQVGRAQDLAGVEAEEQTRRQLALSRTEPTPTRVDMGAVLGLALIAAAAGVATSRFPLATTD